MASHKELHTTQSETEKAVLIAVSTQKQGNEKTREYLVELAFLAETLGIETVQTFIQKLDQADVRTYLGKGKLQELATYVKDNPVDMIICDDDLSPLQQRNLEETVGDVKVMDRGRLILDIFAMRAKTAQAKLAVELAKNQYLYPRLTRMRGQQEDNDPIRGQGETQLETDRRIVRDRITMLKEKLEKVDTQSQTRGKERNQLVRVALVGYTNVGKSTLMRQLSKAEVYVENKLFATLDSTVRQVYMNGISFLLTDTVGFIRKLPNLLIESFKSTLDEIREADILLVVEDISNPAFAEHLDVVFKTLTEIGAVDTTKLLVFNKIDLYEPPVSIKNGDKEEIKNVELSTDPLDQFKRTYSNEKVDGIVFVSAALQENMQELHQQLFSLVKEKHLVLHPDWTEPSY